MKRLDTIYKPTTSDPPKWLELLYYGSIKIYYGRLIYG